MEPNLHIRSRFREMDGMCHSMKGNIQEVLDDTSMLGRAYQWWQNPQGKMISQIGEMSTEIKNLNNRDDLSSEEKISVARGTQNILNSFEEISRSIPNDSTLTELRKKLEEATKGILNEMVKPEEVFTITSEPIQMNDIITDCQAKVDQTYDSDGSGNIDISHVNEEYSFAYVVDGSGHNKPDLKPVQDKLFREFNRSYPIRLETSGIHTVDEMRMFLEKQLKGLGGRISQTTYRSSRGYEASMSDSDPAISFVQVVKEGDRQYLLTAQLADCLVLIRCADGSSQAIYKTGENYNSGLGREISSTEWYYPKVEVHNIEPGSEVFGFTDGIAEFLTLDELNSAIDSNTDRSHLLDELKELVIQKGIDFDKEHGLTEATREEKRDKRYEMGEITPANGEKLIKYWLPDNRQYHDDISSFSFKLK